jgi:hypothetical protein
MALLLHLDAQAIAGKSNGASITSWSDLSGSLHHAVSGVGSIPAPVYKSNALGALPVVRFAGAALKSAFAAPAPQPNTIYLLAKLSNSVTYGYVLDGADAAARHYLLTGDGGSTVLLGSNGNDASRPWTADDQSGFHLFTIVYDGAATELFRDGVPWMRGPASAFTGALTGLTLGARYDGGNASNNIEIAEVRLYEEGHTFQEQRAIEQAIAAHWGILQPPAAKAVETDFAGATIGQIPAGWTKFLHPDATWETVASSGFGGRAVKASSDVDKRQYLTWDEFEPNAQNFEFVVKARATGTFVAGPGVFLRGVGPAGLESGYQLYVENSSSPLVNINRVRYGQNGELIGTVAARSAPALGEWWGIRGSVQGGQLRLKAWAWNDAAADYDEPLGWDVSIEDYTNTRGTFGLYYFYAAGAVEYDYVSVATDGAALQYPGFTAPPPTPPPAPTGLAATAVAYNRVDLTWNDVEGETGYEIYRSTAFPVDTGDAGNLIGTTDAGETTYSDTTTGGSTQYYYRVRAINDYGGEDSGHANALTPAAPASPPGTITNLAAAAVSATRIDLSWGDVSGETSYEVYRGASPGFAPDFSGGSNRIAAGLPAGTITFSDITASPATTYYYRVVARNSSGTTTSNLANATTAAGSGELVAGVIAVGARTASSIALSVNPGGGTAPYSCLWEWSADGSTGWASFGGSGLFVTHSGLDPSTIAYYRCTVTDSADPEASQTTPVQTASTLPEGGAVGGGGGGGGFMVLQRRYGLPAEITFGLFNASGTLVSGASLPAGSVRISRDGGSWTNVGALPASHGALYRMSLSATEMTARQIAVTVIDPTGLTWLDTALLIETYGHASAQHVGAMPTVGADGGALVSADSHGGLAAAVLDLANGIEANLTPRQALRVITSVLLGLSSGVSGGAPLYRAVERDAAGVLQGTAKVRVRGIATNGDRASITIDPE